MKKKGFTLIELLAVIVILAILALILVPMINELVYNARKQVFKNSIYGIINSADTYVAEYALVHNGGEISYPTTFTCNGSLCIKSDNDYLQFKGKIPTGGDVVINPGGVLIDYVTDGVFCAYGYKWNLQLVDDCESVPTASAGLFDANDNLVADWNTLVNTYGFAIDKDYTSYDMDNDDSGNSLYYILENNSELSEGVKLVISNSVSYIGEYSVAYVEQLKTVIIPDSVRIIGKEAFDYNFIENLVIGNNVERIEDHAFESSLSLKVLNIPDSVKYIGESAFYSSGLVELTIGSGVEEIIGYTFGDCWDLTSLTIKNGNAIESYAFSYDENIEYLSVSQTTVLDDKFCVGHKLKTLIIGDGVERIETGYGSEDLVTVELSEDITYIGEYAFQDSPNLTSINLPSNLETIRYSAFSNTGLTEIVIPDSVTTIDNGAFYGCTSLENVVIGDGVTGELNFNDLFERSNNIKNVIVGDGVTAISSGGFSNFNINTITFGANVNTIGSYAFGDASSLTSMTFTDTSKNWYYKYYDYEIDEEVTVDFSVSDPVSNVELYKNTRDLGVDWKIIN